MTRRWHKDTQRNTRPYSIRKAQEGDAAVVARIVRCMLEEMAPTGGRPVARDAEPWIELEKTITQEIAQEDHVHFLAELPGPDIVGLAKGSAIRPMFLFEPKRTLHIHAVYVNEAQRRTGIGRALIEALLDWGRRSGCEEAALNVLVGNPARALYEKMGFCTFELEMTRSL